MPFLLEVRGGQHPEKKRKEKKRKEKKRKEKKRKEKKNSGDGASPRQEGLVPLEPDASWCH